MPIEDFLPQDPEKGPPLPKKLNLKWPWVEKSDPLLVDYTPIDAEVERLKEATRREWEAKGYRPGLIEKGLLWAEEWTSGLIRSPLYAPLSEETRRRIAVDLYKTGLSKAEEWVRAFMES
jgi:hypothetical protein